MGIFDHLRNMMNSKAPEVIFPVILGAAAKGKVVPMEQIPDPVFAEGVLGTCCGIDPTDGKVYSPVDGKIVSLADTLHAVGIEGVGGVEVLIHVGVDTVDMKGDGFANCVQMGQAVRKGQLLLTMDLEKIAVAGHPATVISVVTNTDSLAGVELVADGTVEPGDAILKVSK